MPFKKGVGRPKTVAQPKKVEEKKEEEVLNQKYEEKKEAIVVEPLSLPQKEKCYCTGCGTWCADCNNGVHESLFDMIKNNVISSYKLGIEFGRTGNRSIESKLDSAINSIKNILSK